ncbi:MAG: right-handed parallel beta-helix repeat-containing protein [Methanotrichaceae archaeon]
MTGRYDRMRWGLILALMLISVSVTQAATITVGADGGDYTSIQKAVDAADPGDTINVESGKYYEKVVVDKRLTLRGVDTGEGLPTLSAVGIGSAITLTADETRLERFIIKNASVGKAGVYVKSDKNTIKGNYVISNKWYGMHFEGSSNNTVVGNTVRSNRYGIWLDAESNDNEIIRNELLDNENYNATDAGVNRWNENVYGDFDERDSIYKIPGGGSNIDEDPRAPEPTPTVPPAEPITITIKITIPAPVIAMTLIAAAAGGL